MKKKKKENSESDKKIKKTILIMINGVFKYAKKQKSVFNFCQSDISKLKT